MSRNAIAIFAVIVAGGFAGCAATAHSQNVPAQPAAAVAPAPMAYNDASPDYRFFPGDEIEITVFSAPELSRTVTVAPDGRITLPMIAPIQAANLTSTELHDALVSALSVPLRTPELDVIPKTFASRQVFVGGEVARPGIYAMPAAMDAFQAVALAGGFLPSARRGDVMVMSRGGDGVSHVTDIDLSDRALRHGFAAATPLNRYDVVYVPRSRISKVNLFMQQYVRDALPIQFSLYYDLNPASHN